MKNLNVLDNISKSEKRHGNIHRFKGCTDNECIPVAAYVNYDGIGCCCGLISDADDLDCISVCDFHLSADGSGVNCISTKMTPDEAAEMASVLAITVSHACLASKAYMKAHRITMRRAMKGIDE